MEEDKNLTSPDTEEVIIEESTLEGEPVPETEGEAQKEPQKNTGGSKSLSPARTVAKRFFRSKLSMVGLAILVALFLFSFFGPLFSPWGEAQEDKNVLKEVNGATMISYTAEDAGIENPTGEESWIGAYVTYKNPDSANGRNIFAPPSKEHLLGTDSYGYDVFTRLMYGGRVSLTIGFVVVILETIIGVILGLLAGYFGGWVDNLIMRVVDILSCVPSLPLLLILSAVLRDIPAFQENISTLYLMMVVLCLLGWTGTARLVRGQVLSLREQEFMIAAKSSGLSTGRKIFKHLLPNVIPQLIVSMTMGLGGVILMEATLGFLGIGAPIKAATWGSLVNINGLTQKSMRSLLQYYSNLWMPAGVCITLAILGFNFVGDGLRDAFDPKMKR